MRELRWKCDERGCYRQLMPRLGAFDDCFPGRIGMSDVDGIVEISGKFLLLEWKSAGGAVTGGQRIMFEQLTRLAPSHITVVVVSGDPVSMHVSSVQVFKSGTGSLPIPCSLERLQRSITAWAERARLRIAA